MRNLIIGFSICIAIIAALFVGMRFSEVKEKYQSIERRVAQPEGSNVEIDTNKRVALVIGNRDYTVGRLTNTINDARGMTSALKELGFEVIEGLNLTQKETLRKINEFRNKLKSGAGVGLFYYSGHGLQVNGENYLVPVKSNIEIEEDVEIEGVKVQRILTAMEAARNGMNIVILDACRNNPWAKGFRSSGGGGLVSMTAPKGTLIAYATEPGSLAQDRNFDGSGKNGLYTGVLLEKMRIPGFTIERMFKEVLKEVDAKSGGRQVPWYHSSYTGEFVFNPSEPKPESPQLAKPTHPQKEEVAILPQLEIQVTHKQRYGSLAITSPISGVEVWLGKKSLGKTQSGSEMLASKVPVGSYKVKANKKGYKPWEKEVEVEADRVHTLPIKLKPIQSSNQQVASIPKPEHKPTLKDREKALSFAKRGYDYEQKKDYNKAIKEYTKAIELNPKSAIYYNNRGVSYDDLGKYTTAIADYTKAIELNPKYADAYSNRGVSYHELGKYTTAIADYTKAIELNPKHADAYSNRGVSYRKLNQHDKAVADFKKAKELRYKD